MAVGNTTGPGGAGSLGGVYTDYQTQVGGDNKVGDEENKVGGGNFHPAGTVPGTPNDPSYSKILDSFAKLVPKLSGEQLQVLMLEITMKLKEAQEANAKEKIQIDSEAKRSMIAEKKDKIDESNTKIEAAEEKRKSTEVWDKVKMAFQAIGAALAIVVGIAMIATGFGIGPGIAMIAVGVLGLTMVADAAVRAETGMGIGGHAAKARGEDEAGIARSEMAFGCCMAGLAIVGSIVAFLLPGGQTTAVMTMIQSVSTLSNAALGIGTAAGDVATGIIRYDATKIQAEGQKMQAEAKEIEAFIMLLDDFIDQSLQRLSGTSDRFNAMVDGLMEALQDTARTHAKAKFTG